jgi:3-isopropylmalate dehydrogenase
MTHKILLVAGDGIGPEIVGATEQVLEVLRQRFGLQCEIEHALMGGCAIDATGDSLPDATLALARSADAILFGAVGGAKWDNVERAIRPERGLLRLRAELDLFCNLRPAVLFPALADASTLKAELVSGLDLMIIRELTGGIYFGDPRGIEVMDDGPRRGFNTMVYREDEIERIARQGFEIAAKRSGRLCSVDKANVLEVSELWRDVVQGLAVEYPDIELEHIYVDNAAMQLVRMPKQFDVIVTSNLFGDILSDLAAMLTGSIGMLPSASLNEATKGLFEPVHGSAPDIAGKDVANPLATMLSASMMLRYSLNEAALADKLEAAVGQVLQAGIRTADIAGANEAVVGTRAMTAAIIDALGQD